MQLHSVDRASITILADNHTDPLFPGGGSVTRPFLLRGSGRPPLSLLAEHGFSALVRLWREDREHVILLDAGLSGSVVVHNAAELDLDLAAVEAVVISHGHMDHTAGLGPVSARFARPVPAFVHPDAFLQRFVYAPELTPLPQLDPGLAADGMLDFIRITVPTLLADGCALVTGEIPRRTDFEHGMPVQYAIRDGELTPDPLVMDDQSLVFVVRDRGPVIVSACAHAGIINTIRAALTLTGAERPLAVIGGFHLCLPTSEETIQRTIEELRALNPELVVPCHCTGMAGIQRLAGALGEVCAPGLVGTGISLEASSATA